MNRKTQSLFIVGHEMWSWKKFSFDSSTTANCMQETVTTSRVELTLTAFPGRCLQSNDGHFIFGLLFDLDLQHLVIECKLRKYVHIYNLSIKLNIMKIGQKLFTLWSKRCFLLIRSQSEKSRSRTLKNYHVHNFSAGTLPRCKNILEGQVVFENLHLQNWVMTKKKFFFRTFIWPWPLTQRGVM